jgi:undecaprenyl-diphosphatase
MNAAIARLDRRWTRNANRWGARPRVRGCFRAASKLGDGPLWYVLIAVLAIADGFGPDSLQLALTVGCALLLYRWLKRRTRRPRPFFADPDICLWERPLDEFSFPSGHTLHAVAFSAVACLHWPMLAWVLLPLTAGIAVSRIVLGLHYPSDVLAAMGIGGALAAASFGLRAASGI